MGKVIVGRFPHSFPRSRRGRKRLEPVKVGQFWAKIQTGEWWRVEKISMSRRQMKIEQPSKVRHVGRRIHIRHIDGDKYPNGASWLVRDFSEIFFRRCFMEEEEYEKFCAEIRRKGASIPFFDPESRALLVLGAESDPA